MDQFLSQIEIYIFCEIGGVGGEGDNYEQILSLYIFGPITNISVSV